MSDHENAAPAGNSDEVDEAHQTHIKQSPAHGISTKRPESKLTVDEHPLAAPTPDDSSARSAATVAALPPPTSPPRRVQPSPAAATSGTPSPAKSKQDWVKFDDSSEPSPLATSSDVDIPLRPPPAATIPTTTSQVQTNGGPAVIEIPIGTADSGDGLASGSSQPSAVAAVATAAITVTSEPGSQLRTIELPSGDGRIREGFVNGDIIVTLLPVNTKWPWVTPAVFRPELVPEELMAQGLTLTVEEYVHAMESLVNDYRFTLYNVCYKRILCCWIVFAFSVLMGLLFSGLNGIALFSLGVGWLFLNASAIFVCMWLKLRLSRGLERCVAAVNRQLLRHKIVVVLDDRGNVSCHKVNLCFLYFEPARCVKFLNDYIARSEQNGVPIEAGWEERLDVDVNDIVIQGSNTTRVSRKQERGELVLLRYLQRWGRDVRRGRADISPIEPARHCNAHICPCQYVEAHLRCKPRGPPSCKCCLYLSMGDPGPARNFY